jgi:hypothetical protein
MKLEELKERVGDGCQELNLPEPKTSRQGFSFIKVEIKIRLGVSIEIYFNEETQSLTSALVIRGKRAFGIDNYPKSGVSHMHPLGRVEKHLKINPMQIEEILEEYAKVLQQL